MSNHLMNSDPHERARLMIAVSGPDLGSSVAASEVALSRAEQSWLAAHLESCSSCREFQESTSDAICSLRGSSVTAGAQLVSSTQMRVRQRAEELQRQQERLWIVCACCMAVTLSTAVTTALLWLGVGWMGLQAQVSTPVWQGGFAVFCLMPAVLAGILLLARGTFLADHNGSSFQH